MQTEARRGVPIGAVLAVVGGALLVIGSFLSWAEVSGGGVSVSAKGIDGSDGYITVVAGLVALAVGVAALRMPRRPLAVLAIIAGLVGGGLGVYDAVTAEDSVLDAAAEEIAPQFGATAEEVRSLLDDAIASGQLDISISIGLYVVIAGGVLALIGGVLQLTRAGAPAMPAVAPAGIASAHAAPVAPPPPARREDQAPPPAPPPPEPPRP